MTTVYAGFSCMEVPTWPGLDLAGFVARENPSTGLLDPIYARALALQSGERPFLLIIVDCLGFEPEFLASIRAALPDADIFLAATHVHSAPATQALRYCGTPNQNWLDLLHEVIVHAGKQALAELQPAHLAYGQGITGNVTTNRRKSGLHRSQQQPIDPNVDVLTVTKESGETLTTLVRFTCHPVILGHQNVQVSSDWPGLVRKQMEEITGAPAMCMNGASGDVNPYRRGSWKEVEGVAHAVVRAAHEAIQRSTPVEPPVVQVAREDLLWNFRPLESRALLERYVKEYMQRAEAEQLKGSLVKMRIALAYAEWASQALELNGTVPPVTTETMVARIGDLALVSAPGELFVELGLAIQVGLLKAGYRAVLISGYSNGNIGYIPTRSAYLKGGYEVETAHRYYGRHAALDPACGEMLVTKSIELGKKLLAASPVTGGQPALVGTS